MRHALPILLILAACSTPVQIRFGAHQSHAPVVAISNPSFGDGDPIAGRRTFIEMQCVDCHRVAEDPALPLGRRTIAGPVLSDLKRYPPHELANRIVSPVDREMKDYAQPMNARQLVDVVAYLRNPAAGRG